MLPDFLVANTQELIARTRAKVATRSTPPPTEDELKNGIPLFLCQIVDRLRLATLDNGAIEESATRHGADLHEMGFTVGQVVHDYGDVCQAVTELAEATNAPITTDEFHTLNRCLDDAIAHAVAEYARRRERSISHERTERMGSFSRELSSRLTAAMLSYNILKKGNVALGGSTGAVLDRSLRGLRDLVNQSLAELRLESAVQERRRLSVVEMIRGVEVEASLEASARGLTLTVAHGALDVDVEADPQILAAAVADLLENAFKRSRPAGRVALRATATADRALVEIEDERGDLPPGLVEALSLPLERQDPDRDGLGVLICRKGVAASGGRLHARDVPGKGSVFTIDLPRHASTVGETPTPPSP